MFRRYALLAALVASRAAAQTFTSCNPLNSTCPANAALGTTFQASWDQSSTELGSTDLWNITAGQDHITFSENGTSMTAFKQGDSVTAQTNFYIFWGEVEVQMMAAPGTGIISSIVLLSDDLDEIDFEIMGGNHTHFETNWYGHGNLSQINSIYYPISDPTANFHNYTYRWDQNKIDWLVDGNVVRTLPAAASGLYPQTPSFLRVGVWPAGQKGQPEGTIKWAGGEVDWSQGPFTMNVKSIKVTDGTTNSSSYVYGGTSGSWQSIKVDVGQSAAYGVLHHVSAAQAAQQRWDGLPMGAKIGIACAVGAVLLIGIIAFAWFCIAQRRAGKAEKLAADRFFDEQQTEVMAYRSRMAKGGFAISSQSYHHHGEKF